MRYIHKTFEHSVSLFETRQKQFNTITKIHQFFDPTQYILMLIIQICSINLIF